MLSTVVVRDRSVMETMRSGHFLRRQTVVVPNDADYRDINVRENVGRGAQDGEYAADQDENGQYYEGIRPPQC
jgi:hypothetical protein